MANENLGGKPEDMFKLGLYFTGAVGMALNYKPQTRAGHHAHTAACLMTVPVWYPLSMLEIYSVSAAKRVWQVSNDTILSAVSEKIRNAKIFQGNIDPPPPTGM